MSSPTLPPGVASRPPERLPTARLVNADPALIAAALGRDIDPLLLAAGCSATDGAVVTYAASPEAARLAVEVAVEVEVDGETYQAVRTLYRSAEGELVCSNNMLEVDLTRPQRPRGLHLFISQVRALRAAGFHLIRLVATGHLDHPNGFNGYYSYPRYGCEGIISEERFAALPVGVRTALGESRSLLDLFEVDGGADAWRACGGTVRCVFDLADGSRSLAALERYADSQGQV